MQIDVGACIRYINNQRVSNFMSPPDATAPTPSDLSPPEKRRERRKDARPGELLAAALDLFVERGFAATKVDDVAKRAGVSKGTLFLYFPSKEELFKAVVRETIVGRLSEFRGEIEAFEGDSSALVREVLHRWWQEVGATKAGGISKLIMSEAGNFPELATFYFEEVIRPGNYLIEQVLARGVARGELTIGNMQHSVHAIVAPMLHMTCWKHSISPCLPSEHQIDPMSYLHTIADILLLGMARRDTESRP